MGTDDDACCEGQAELLASVVSPISITGKQMTELGNRLLKDLKGAAPMVPLALRRVMRFPKPQVLDEPQPAIQAELPLVVFPACSAHSECENNLVTASGNLDVQNNATCSRQFAMARYCAAACHTGGCSPFGGELPEAKGPFCQPCDVCVPQADGVPSGPCPKWCADYTVDSEGNFPRMKTAGLLPSEQRPVRPLAVQDLPGPFTLVGRTRYFTTQWIFEERVTLPGLLGQFEEYASDTGELVCWPMNPYTRQFRNRWDERK